MAKIPTLQKQASGVPSAMTSTTAARVGQGSRTVIGTGDYTKEFAGASKPLDDLAAKVKLDHDRAAVNGYENSLMTEAARIRKEASLKTGIHAAGAQEAAQLEFTQRADELSSQLASGPQRAAASQRRLGIGSRMSDSIGVHEARETRKHNRSELKAGAGLLVNEYASSTGAARLDAMMRLGGKIEELSEFDGLSPDESAELSREVFAGAGAERIHALMANGDIAGARGELDKTGEFMDAKQRHSFDAMLSRQEGSNLAVAVATDVYRKHGGSPVAALEALESDPRLAGKPDALLAAKDDLKKMVAQKKAAVENQDRLYAPQITNTKDFANGNTIRAMAKADPAVLARISPELQSEWRNGDIRYKISRANRQARSADRSRAGYNAGIVHAVDSIGGGRVSAAINSLNKGSTEGDVEKARVLMEDAALTNEQYLHARKRFDAARKRSPGTAVNQKQKANLAYAKTLAYRAVGGGTNALLIPDAQGGGAGTPLNKKALEKAKYGDAGDQAKWAKSNFGDQVHNELTMRIEQSPNGGADLSREDVSEIASAVRSDLLMADPDTHLQEWYRRLLPRNTDLKPVASYSDLKDSTRTNTAAAVGAVEEISDEMEEADRALTEHQKDRLLGAYLTYRRSDPDVPTAGDRDVMVKDAVMRAAGVELGIPYARLVRGLRDVMNPKTVELRRLESERRAKLRMEAGKLPPEPKKTPAQAALGLALTGGM